MCFGQATQAGQAGQAGQLIKPIKVVTVVKLVKLVKPIKVVTVVKAQAGQAGQIDQGGHSGQAGQAGQAIPNLLLKLAFGLIFELIQVLATNTTPELYYCNTQLSKPNTTLLHSTLSRSKISPMSFDNRVSNSTQPARQANSDNNHISSAYSETVQKKERWVSINEFNFFTNEAEEIKKKLRRYGKRIRNFDPYPWQVEAATVVTLKKDLLVSVRTGAGKSMVFQLLMGARKNSTMIVISPLNALIEEQVALFNNSGIPAVGIIDSTLDGHVDEVWNDIDKGKYRVILTGPERLLYTGSPFWHRLLNRDVKAHPFLSRLDGITIDEAHVVHKWGASGFRIEYRNINALRAHFPNVPFLLLSATMTAPVKSYVHEVVGLGWPTYVMKSSMHRPNLRLICCEMQSSPTSAKGWIDLDFLWENIAGAPSYSKIPKTMIFFDGKDKCQEIANYIRRKLLQWKGANGEEDPVQRKEMEEEVRTLVSPFSAGMPDFDRREVMKDFRDGKCRILVCTDAAGMGMDISDVEVCIQLGLTSFLTLADVWQRLGRCARGSGMQGEILIFAQKSFLLPNLPTSCYSNTVSSMPIDWAILANTTTSEPNYYLPVCPGQTKVEAERNLQLLHAQNYDSNKKQQTRTLEPGLLWLLTTTGCRQRIPMVLFEDPKAFDSDVWSAEKPCLCDNCCFPPREYYDRLEAPEEIKKRDMGAPGMIMGEKTPAYTVQELKDLRLNNIAKFRDISTSLSGLFPLSKSLRYMDSAAYENDLYLTRLQQFTASSRIGQTKHVSKKLVALLMDGVKALMMEIYIRENIKVAFGLKFMDFFPESLLRKLARAKASGRPMATVHDMTKIFGTEYDLESSGYRTYLRQISTKCESIASQYYKDEADKREKKQREKEEQAKERKKQREESQKRKAKEKLGKRRAIDTKHENAHYNSQTEDGSEMSDATALTWSASEMSDVTTLSWSETDQESSSEQSRTQIQLSRSPFHSRATTPSNLQQHESLASQSTAVSPYSTSRVRETTPLIGLGKKRKLNPYECIMDVRSDDAPLLTQSGLDTIRQQRREASISSELEKQITSQNKAKHARHSSVFCSDEIKISENITESNRTRQKETEESIKSTQESIQPQPRGRGRPRKVLQTKTPAQAVQIDSKEADANPELAKPQQQRKRQLQGVAQATQSTQRPEQSASQPRKRGRPRKVVQLEEQAVEDKLISKEKKQSLG